MLAKFLIDFKGLSLKPFTAFLVFSKVLAALLIPCSVGLKSPKKTSPLIVFSYLFSIGMSMIPNCFNPFKNVLACVEIDCPRICLPSPSMVSDKFFLSGFVLISTLLSKSVSL